MDTNYFSLGNVEKNHLVRIARALFGILCIAVAVGWIIISIYSTKAYGSVWITVIFMTGFGFYQIWAGIGKAEKYIEIGKEEILLKKYPFLPPVRMSASETDKIEFFSLKVIFILKSGKKVLLRFGTTWYEVNERISKEISIYADENNISTEIIEEEI